MSRGHIGDVEVIRLEDSPVGGPMVMFWSEDQLGGRYQDLFPPESYDPATGVSPQPSSSWLVRDGDQVVLVDTGPGDMPRAGMRDVWPGWPQADGQLIRRLAAEGVSPEDVDLVLVTHLHFDHVGGFVRMQGGELIERGGQPVLSFPNARYVFSRREYETTRAEMRSTGGPEFLRRIFWESVEPVVRAGAADLTEGVCRVSRSLTAVPSPGHSPGHLRFDLSSRGAEGIFCGDQFHYPLQVAQVHQCLNTAYDPGLDQRSRRELLSDAADRGAVLFPAHLHDPSVLRVRRTGGTFTYSLGWD